ncbi:MAG: hypothetical protein ACU0CO_15805 [Shimia sp.]
MPRRPTIPKAMRSAVLAAFLCALPLAAALPGAASAQAWCAADRLNATEATICAWPRLGALDADLAAAYRASDAPGKRAAQTAWLRDRDGCGRDVPCIADAYETRIAALTRPARDLRPWCGAARLNATEAMICSDRTLAALDAVMAATYGDLRARDATQDEWLRGRDACGRDVDCVTSAYLTRLIALGDRLIDEGR